MKLKLTESDLHGIIASAVKYALREGIEGSELLSQIVERLSTLNVNAKPGENELEVPMDAEGNTFAYIIYYVKDDRYMEHSVSTYTEPEMGGEYDVTVSEIYLYDEEGEETQIQDNGMIANALKNLITVDNNEIGYETQDDQSGYNDSWK